MNAITSISKLRPPKSSAVELYAKPSPDYARKLAHARLVLREAAELGHVTQANSLGVEDMVVSHLINALALPIPIFVLDTGRLHTETLALLERLQAHSRAPVQVFRPQPEAVQDYIRANGQDAIYQSIELRKSCCAIRKLETGCGLFICNLGTGKGYSVLEVLHAFEKACGHELPYVIEDRRPGDIAACYADPTKAKNELGWVAEYGIEEMCADSWNWQKNNPDGYHTVK